MRKRERSTIACAALAAATAVALLAAPAATAVTTEQVEFTGRYSKRDRNKERGGHQLRTTIRIQDDTAPRATAADPHHAPLPEGRGRQRALLPEVQPGALRQRARRAARGARGSARAARSARRPRS